jgi:hypothetical protein
MNAFLSGRNRPQRGDVTRESYPGTVNVPDDFPLARELEVFEQHRQELMARAAGRYELVHGDQLAGEFDTEGDAIAAGYERFGNVAFLVKKIEPVDVPRHFVYYVGVA